MLLRSDFYMFIQKMYVFYDDTYIDKRNEAKYKFISIVFQIAVGRIIHY